MKEKQNHFSPARAFLDEDESGHNEMMAYAWVPPGHLNRIKWLSLPLYISLIAWTFSCT